MKLALVVMYIAFGIAAMREKLSIGLRCLCLGGAVMAYFYIIGIAIVHMDGSVSRSDALLARAGNASFVAP